MMTRSVTARENEDARPMSIVIPAKAGIHRKRRGQTLRHPQTPAILCGELRDLNHGLRWTPVFTGVTK